MILYYADHQQTLEAGEWDYRTRWPPARAEWARDAGFDAFHISSSAHRSP